jgi:hypothetical protein
LKKLGLFHHSSVGKSSPLLWFASFCCFVRIFYYFIKWTIVVFCFQTDLVWKCLHFVC